jgi:flagellar basal body-associated protein FliL
MLDGAMSWPEAIFYLGVLVLVTFLIALFVVGTFESRKAKRQAQQAEDLRQLVRRFEQLAENTLDAQQRVATDLAELRARTASIEQILRTVE